ncbi:MAG TPA: SAM-dependent methyltransferase [Aggregatilineaceae bacterium]|nr:SAM-dependent methyltransferase [Aggregatilineaceae bacterium]
MSSERESQPSASALAVALCRTVASYDPRVEIRGQDYLAEIFLSEEARKTPQDVATHTAILKKLAAVSPGGYEFFIARTAYLDAVMQQALRAHIPQVVFLGAGYDTRTFRFSDLIQDTRIFELDTPATQQHKRAALEQAQVAIPPQLTFIPIDFNQDRMVDKLVSAGYATNQKTLFIWEGVSYYLPLTTVDETLTAIRHNSQPGSILCFDYMIAASDLAHRFGAVQARASMQAMYTVEPLHFDLEIGQVAAFLSERGFRVIEHLTTEDMQKRYLTCHDGTLAGQVLDLFGLIQAEVQG